jgi:uncharacterized membrane protein YsdA (DUF1294 family)
MISHTVQLFAGLLLLLLPIEALRTYTGQVDPLFFYGALIVVNIATALAFWNDKRAASTARRRVPEAMLHLLELLGGWPASFYSQRLFRHKTAKRSYQIICWIIIALHQALALDIILGGMVSRAL